MKIKEISVKDFDKEIEKGKVLVDFNADWCGPCRMIRPILEEIADDYKIISVNVDNAEELAKKYRVFSIPCLIVFEDGFEINRSVGLKSKDEIEELLGGD